MKTPFVGQEVWIRPTGYCRSSGRGDIERLTAGTVVSLGRKYFTVQYGECHAKAKFRLADWRQETGGHTETITVYRTYQEYEDTIERSEIVNRIRKAFDSLTGNCVEHLSIYTLRIIDNLVSPRDASAESSKPDA